MYIKAILFDCDGVLVDSEPLTNTVLRDLLAESGWDMPLDECMRRFVGKTVREERAAIEQHTGQPLTDAWMACFYQRRNAALEAGLQIMAGALSAVQAAHQAVHGQIACASGADRFKVEMQLRKVGLLPYFDGRVFSGHEMARSKPAPDVYLAAAQHLAVPPEICLVVEDSLAGVAAGVAAGATVWAFCPDAANASALRQAGAQCLFAHMGALPALLADLA